MNNFEVKTSLTYSVVKSLHLIHLVIRDYLSYQNNLYNFFKKNSKFATADTLSSKEPFPE